MTADQPLRRVRVGQHWGTTVVAEGDGAADERGRRAGDELVAVAFTPEGARLIVDAVNARGGWPL